MQIKNYGGIAQLGERLHGMQEVSGSIPLTSTNKTETAPLWCCFCLNREIKSLIEPLRKRFDKDERQTGVCR